MACVLLLWYIIILLIVRDKLSYLCLLDFIILCGVCYGNGKPVIICNKQDIDKNHVFFFLFIRFYFSSTLDMLRSTDYITWLKINVTLSCKIFIKIYWACYTQASDYLVRKGYSQNAVCKQMSMARFIIIWKFLCCKYIPTHVCSLINNVHV